MTLKRQKWWDSLPETQKYLRREISRLKYKRSEEKLHASRTWSVTIRKVAIMRINNYTAHIRALKHELNRGIKDVEVEYCPWCGGEIKGWKE